MEKNGSDFIQLMDVFAGLVQATRCCRQDTAFCGGVTLHQYMILDAVFKKGNLRIADLHGILGVEKSTTTRLVNPLIAKGLLTKEPSASDSRSFTLALTRKGTAAHLKVRDCLANFFYKIQQNLPAGKQENILQSVQTFTAAIRNASNTCLCCE